MNSLQIGFDVGEHMLQALPFLVMAGGGLLVMLVDAFVKSLRKDHLSMLCLLVLLGSVIAQFAGDSAGTTELFYGMMAHDAFSRFFNLLFVAIALLTITFATGVYDRDGRFRSDFYPLILFSTLGMMLVVAATDLMTLFLGIETMSLSIYILVGGNRGSLRSSEAGLKYLILGGFASAFMLFGMALLYGQCGGTAYSVIYEALAAGTAGGLGLAVATGMILIGFSFKLAMVPFHMWTPDVYEGAPASITGYMATGVKAAAMAGLLRIVWLLLPVLADIWLPLLSVLTVLTMTLGNLVALSQTSIKRMLAYSSIAHAGYLMLGVLAIMTAATDATIATRMDEVTTAAGGAVLFYLVGYALMNLGAFGVIAYLGRNRDEEADMISGYSGLAVRQPLVAATMAVFMFSMAGIPPTVGFIGKFYIFDAVVKAGMIPMAIFGVLNSLLSVFFYLRVIVKMYMKPEEETAYEGRNWETAFATTILAILVIFLGVFPGSLFELASMTFRILAF
jgi:NADH-quinone oxidoreductase subunit N